jgi:phosphoribosylpyrophosphate synthetase
MIITGDEYQNSIGRRITIVAGSNPEDIETAEGIVNTLTDEYHLEGIGLVKPHVLSDAMRKQPREMWPVAYGQFSDGETQFESGERALKDLMDNKHIVFVKHFYSPLATKHISDSIEDQIKINDNITEMRAFGSILKRASGRRVATPVKFTVAAPYIPYVRSHSIDKYEEQGHFQADTLDLFVDDLVNAQVNEVIGIDSHSNKIDTYLSDRKVFFQHIDPFKDPRRKDWRLYQHMMKGLSTPDRDKALLSLCPFAELYEGLRKEGKSVTLVEPDGGSYYRTKEFAFNTGIGLENILSLKKERDGEGKSRIVGIRHYSVIQETDIKDRYFLIIDDLISSGGTTINIAEYLKNHGAAGVLVWVSHNAGRDPRKLTGSQYIDEVVMLDTVHNFEADKIRYLKKSHIVLAGGIYKSHMNHLYGGPM